MSRHAGYALCWVLLSACGGSSAERSEPDRPTLESSPAEESAVPEEEGSAGAERRAEAPSSESEAFTIAPSDPLLDELDRSRAERDIQNGELNYYYWGNIVMLPSDFPERAERAGLTIYVVPECCRSIPPGVKAYNDAVVEAYDEAHGQGSFQQVLRDMVEAFQKENPPPSRPKP